MVELIAWDSRQQMFNFYELVGSPGGSTWFYRGNSADIWADTAKLHLDRRDGEPVFGSKLRCSGCHVAGGPILKEFKSPFDSWWTAERPLPLGGRIPDPSTQQIIDRLKSPDSLRDQIAIGMKKLMAGQPFKGKQASSPQVALRPLFCAEEIQLATSAISLEDAGTNIDIPLGFFLDDRFESSAGVVTSKGLYLSALKSNRSLFPETGRLDGDHAWNTPVKANSDAMAIAILEDNGTIDREFVLDVLAVDFTRPVLSPKRCALVKHLPENWSVDWQQKFQESLAVSQLAEAKELLQNLTLSERTLEFHKLKAQDFKESCKAQFLKESAVSELVNFLGQLREEISISEFSMNPRGQILEPGFRVIFPKFTPTPKPWQVNLDESCLPF
jgi:hypothetical protein